MTLTEDQKLALSALEEWYKNNNELFICLNGSAGTGKTTLVKYFIDTNNLHRTKLAVSAPTHKAKQVISEKTEIQGFTIHKLLGIKLDVDILNFDPLDPAFRQVGNPLIDSFRLVIVDEASMINKELYETLYNTCNARGIKVLFIGDELQLNPVKERISPVFTNNKCVTLTTIVRQDNDNPLLDILTQLREDIQNDKQRYLSIIRSGSNVNDKGGYILYDNMEKFKESAAAAIAVDPYNNKVIAWANDVVIGWNTFIKSRVNPSEFELGKFDTIIACKNYYGTDYQILQNGEFMQVVSVLPNTITIDKVTLNLLSCVLEKEDGTKTTLNIVRKSSILDFASVLIKKKEYAKAKKSGYAWKSYYNFRGQYMILEDIYSTQGLIDTKDLLLGYSITTHKSQGSTYNETFIVLNNLLRNPNIKERNRLAYVAISRTSTICHLLLT